MTLYYNDKYTNFMDFCEEYMCEMNTLRGV